MFAGLGGWLFEIFGLDASAGRLEAGGHVSIYATGEGCEELQGKH